jgi:predicted transcriptional regulator of viral defense system
MKTDDRTIIARLARESRAGVIDLSSAANALQMPSRTASIRMSRLLRKGWLQRARRGLFFVLPLEVEPGRTAVPGDSWIVASSAFRPCYIGGWSAAEYWGLTEQIFRSTLVVTAAPVRSRLRNLLGQQFRLFKVPEARINVKTSVWRGAERVLVSSRERTIIDSLRNPEICGGVRLLVSVIQEYVNSKDFSSSELLREASEARSGAVWKRLGLLFEKLWPNNADLIAVARANATLGNIRLDPAVKARGKLSKSWGIWINIDLTNDD